MWGNRFDLEVEPEVETGAPLASAFVAVPAMMTGALIADNFQSQLYHWAYEQAKQAVEIRSPNPVRDLFALMN